MEKQLELFDTRFNHNDLEYEMWYDRSAEMAEDEDGNAIDFECDTVYARTEFAKAYIDWINEELKTNILFSSMFFPKEYNFMTDAINVQFSNDDYEKLKQWFKGDEDNKAILLSKIEGYATSCSGYIAFHSMDEIWSNKGLLMGILLEVFAEVQNGEFSAYFDRQCVYDRLYKEV